MFHVRTCVPYKQKDNTGMRLYQWIYCQAAEVNVQQMSHAGHEAGLKFSPFMLNSRKGKKTPEIIVNVAPGHSSIINAASAFKEIYTLRAQSFRLPHILEAGFCKESRHCNNPVIVIFCMVDMDHPVFNINLGSQKVRGL